ncbi:MAG: DNA-binding transcriptional regulator [Thermoguttaceae bacterium]|nr:DNA-binding transcriptional regulator [Thermoguttaceae bacterium]
MPKKSGKLVPTDSKTAKSKFHKKQVLFLIETSTSYGRDLLTGASRYAHERNEWDFIVVPHGITEMPETLTNWHGDGVIARTSDRRTHDVIKRRIKCPVVELYSVVKTEVYCDERAIVRMALDHFEEHCFENVAFFSIGQTRWIVERERHFKEEAIARGFSPYLFIEKTARKDPTWYPIWNEKYDPALRAWLEKLPKPIAIFTANDHQAVHLINGCNNLGYRIPEEIAVLGINNDTLLCDILSPTLSSIDQNAYEVGYEGARLLDMKMNGVDCAGYEKALLPVRVVARESTDAFALKNPDVNRALHFIRKFATTGIRVTDVLHEVNLTSRTLERYFKETLGHTPEREILMTKLRHASWLLVTSNLSNQRIAELSGFANDRYFCYLFKKEKGMTPQQYRRENKSSGAVVWDNSSEEA